MPNDNLLHHLQHLTRGEHDWRDYATPAQGKYVAKIANQALQALTNNMTIILQAILHNLHQHNPTRQWTHSSPNTATSPEMTLQLHETTLTLTSYHHNDNNPIQSEPDEHTTTISLLDPNFLQTLLQDPRLQPPK